VSDTTPEVERMESVIVASALEYKYKIKELPRLINPVRFSFECPENEPVKFVA